MITLSPQSYNSQFTCLNPEQILAFYMKIYIFLIDFSTWRFTISNMIFSHDDSYFITHFFLQETFTFSCMSSFAWRFTLFMHNPSYCWYWPQHLLPHPQFAKPSHVSKMAPPSAMKVDELNTLVRARVHLPLMTLAAAWSALKVLCGCTMTSFTNFFWHLRMSVLRRRGETQGRSVGGGEGGGGR